MTHIRIARWNVMVTGGLASELIVEAFFGWQRQHQQQLVSGSIYWLVWLKGGWRPLLKVADLHRGGSGLLVPQECLQIKLCQRE